ncbi:hypothetical protein C8R41DRAFT_547160 [Lentinula lateritia]|uniref:Uncharacterized protein n=1 Tax=Lentinula lateritia TaxID=40482 RepID=A0ABQ8V654_9AGAR|nr:hypothetical protein C8R41DRAFT_547160 [Lentinula lateritia]
MRHACDTSSPLFAKIVRSASSMISVIYDTLQNHSSETLGLPPSDPLQALFNAVHISTNTLYPGAHLVESLPILDYLPEKESQTRLSANFECLQKLLQYCSHFQSAAT